VHVPLFRIPLPASIRAYGDIDVRIELIPLKTFVPRSSIPIPHIAVPQMEDVCLKVSDLASNGFVKWLGPGSIPILLLPVPIVTLRHFIKALCGCAIHGPITATKNAGVKKFVLIQKFSAGSPCKPVRTGAFSSI
jgi:hypothetical protein